MTVPGAACYRRPVAALPSACVIGAGSSGIAAVKALAERGIPVDCVEKSDRVGMGNSAMDIAVESSYVARRTIVCGRRGEHVVPKYVFGRPVDQIGVSPLTPLVPFPVRHAFFRAVYRLAVGRVEDYGLPKPDHRLLESHPTLSADFLGRVAQGEVTWKPQIAGLAGGEVRFADGSVEPIDVIVWATGYKVAFPFFDPEFISAPDNELLLYRRVFKPGVDNLFFIALLQPLGPTMPLAEAQGRWIAAYLRGEYRLPSRSEMERHIAREHERMRRRYVASKRHTMEVDFDDYLFALRRECKAGARRAREAGFRLPVTPQARDSTAVESSSG